MDTVSEREKKSPQRVPLNCIIRTAAGERRMRVVSVRSGQCCPVCGASKGISEEK